MKKILAILLSICLSISLAAPAMAAVQTSGAASTLRLESVDGTATLKDGGGKVLKTTNGSRLYNGYELATKKASYAFVSLDNTKAIKLDASTSTEVFQSGKKLEMKVNSGQMFFNVTAPLKSDEALNIRTSTMVTGVRGTSGWIEVVSRYITRVSLLEGELTITSVDPLTGVSRSVTIYAGQTATVVHHGEGKEFKSEIIVDGSVLGGGSGSSSSGGNVSGSGTSSGSGSSTGSGTGSGSSGTSGSSAVSSIIGIPEIGADEEETIENLIDGGIIREEHIVVNNPGLTVETLQEEDVPAFVAVEVEKDEELQQRIEENSPLSVPEIIGNAEERLEAEEAAAEEQDKLIQEAVDQLIAEEVEPLFEEEEAPSSGSSSGGSTPAPVPPASTYTLTVNWVDDSGAELAASTTETLNAGDSYTAEEKVFDGYTFLRSEGDAVTGTMDADKTITFIYAPLTQIDLDDPTTEEVTKALNDGYGIINIANANATPGNLDLAEAVASSATGSIDAGKLMNITSGTVEASQDFPFTVDGTLNIEGSTVMNNDAAITVNGTMNVSDTATVNNSDTGTIVVNSKDSLHVNTGATLNNSGEITIGSSSSGAMTVAGTVNNTGGDLYISSDSELTVTGRINTNTTIVTNGVMTVDGGTITGTGGFFTITNSGNLTVNGTVSYTGQDTPNAAIYTTGGEVVVGSGTVTGTESGITTNGLSSYDGIITVNDGTVSGDTYGINSDAGGSVTVNGGTVSAGNTAIYGADCTISVAGGTVSGGMIGITDGSLKPDPPNINISAGTVATTGSDGTVINGEFTYSGGTLECPDSGNFEEMEVNTAMPQATYDTTKSTYVVDLTNGDPSVRTFTAAASNDQLSHAAGLSYVTTINLNAGGYIDVESITLRDDQILNVNGGNLIIASGYSLSGGTVNVADGAVVENSGSVTITTAMEFTGAGRLINTGSVNVANGGELNLSGTNSDTIPGLDNQAGAELNVAGTLTSAAGSVVSSASNIVVASGGTLSLGGTLNNLGYPDAAGALSVSGTMTTLNGSAINNMGVLNVATTGTLALSGNLNNNYDSIDNIYGYVNIYGTITSETTSTITNTGGYFTFANATSADAAATAASASTLKGKFVNAADSGAVPGSLYVGEYGGDMLSFGGVTFAGTLDNLGEIFVRGGSVVDATGTVNNKSSNTGNNVRGEITISESYSADLSYPGQFNMRGSSAVLNNDANISIDDGILNVYGGTLNNLEYVYDDQGEALSGGDMNVGGVAGELNIHTSAKMVNRGYLEVNVPESAHVYGDLDNYGYIFLGGSYGRLYVEESGTLDNFNGAVIELSRGCLFVAGTLNNNTGATLYNSDGLVDIMGTLNNSGTLTNTYDGNLVLGDWLDENTFKAGILNNFGLLDNQSTLYISPASTLQNDQSLYNAGIIQLGTADGTWFDIALANISSMAKAQLINGSADADPTDTTDNIWNGYARVVNENQNESIEESSGTLYLYSGQLINYGAMYNAPSYTGTTEEDSSDGGIIIGYVTNESGSTTTSEATLVNYGTFTNNNVSFSPSLGNVRFSNLGEYVDKTNGAEVFVMVMSDDADSTDRMVVNAYGEVGTMLGNGNWTDGLIYRLIPGTKAETATSLGGVAATGVTLDLNGVKLTLNQYPLYLNSFYTDNVATGGASLTIMSSKEGGELTTDVTDKTIDLGFGTTLKHVSGIISNTWKMELEDGTLEEGYAIYGLGPSGNEPGCSYDKGDNAVTSGLVVTNAEPQV